MSNRVYFWALGIVLASAILYTIYEPYYSLQNIKQGLERQKILPVLRQLNLSAIQQNFANELAAQTDSQIEREKIIFFAQTTIHSDAVVVFIKSVNRIESSRYLTQNELIRAYVGAVNYFWMRAPQNRARVIDTDHCGFEGLSLFSCHYTLDSNIQLSLILERLGLDWQVTRISVSNLNY